MCDDGSGSGDGSVGMGYARSPVLRGLLCTKFGVAEVFRSVYQISCELTLDVRMFPGTQAKLPWAISTCNSVFKHITDHRSIFEPDEQAIIDNANDVRSGKKAPPRKEDHTGSLQGRVLARQTKF